MALSAFDTLFAATTDQPLPLPSALERLYGPLAFARSQRTKPLGPYVFANFVATLDGVVSLGVPGHLGGGDISGFNQHDRFLMGLLRAVADVIIVGASTLRAGGGHAWTPEHVFPDLADAFADLRAALNKRTPPLNMLVTASGQINLDLPIFQSGEAPVLIATTSRGATRLREHGLPEHVATEVLSADGEIPAGALVEAAGRHGAAEYVLSEGGPHLLTHLLEARCLNELFLTLAPQVAGRAEDPEALLRRPALVMGHEFAPAEPGWATLCSLKRAHDHLFLRYTFPQP
jgi:riboflavin biosynthesis pyrimidine reductase